MRNIVESNEGLLDAYLLIYYYIFFLPSNSYISFHWLNFCNKKLNCCHCFAAEGGSLLPRIPYEEGFHRFVVRIDRIGLKDAHVYLNPFITVSVKGTDKTFRSLVNWHLQSRIESANITILWSVRYTAFFVIERVKRAWLACKIELSSSTRKGAGLHSVEREIVSARKTFSSLSPAGVLSSEQQWSEPKALIPFTCEGKAPVKEASWNNQYHFISPPTIFFSLTILSLKRGA